MSAFITTIFFNNLLREKNNIFLSFGIAIFSIYFSRDVFTARNQIFSFLIFELEIICLIGLLENGKKRYFWFLILLAFLLVLVHDTLYIMFFVMMLPYLADIIISKIFDLEKSYRFEKSNLKNLKYLIILILLSIGIGFCTPIFGTAYTNLVNCMSGVSTVFINELQPVHILNEVSLAIITFLTIGILGFTKTKFKLKDVLFVLGFILFSMLAKRNIIFLYLIGTIYLANMLTSTINQYVTKKEEKAFFDKICNSKLFVVVISSFTLIVCIRNYSTQLANMYIEDHVNCMDYPKYVTEWIKENLDYKNIKIWNSFNWGSYLELHGIKVFVDSRSGMYTIQENPGCTVLEDWYNVTSGLEKYEQKFEKYEITHVLLNNSEFLNTYISEDENYKKIYQDKFFVLYERAVEDKE